MNRARARRLGAARSVLAYSLRRAYKLHDVPHVALGCDASVLGEVRILRNLVLRRLHEFQEAIGLAHEWLQRGARARPSSALRFEELMDRPVLEVRERVMAPDQRRHVTG